MPVLRGSHAAGLAALQLELGPGNNMDVIAAEIASFRRRFPGIDMVMLAELASHGVSLDNAEPLPGPTEQRYQELARTHGLWLLPGSLYERAGSSVYNTAPVIDPSGKVVARHRKIYPFEPYEMNVASGNQHTVFDIPDVGRFGVSICYDMWFPETTRTLAWCPDVDAFVYLLRCADGTLYCGWSTDPERRLREHRAGTASRYTRSRLPVELAWTGRFDTRSDAMREEARIKRLSAAETPAH